MGSGWAGWDALADLLSSLAARNSFSRASMSTDGVVGATGVFGAVGVFEITVGAFAITGVFGATVGAFEITGVFGAADGRAAAGVWVLATG